MKPRALWKSVLILLILLLPGAIVYLIWPPPPNLSDLAQVGAQYDVVILRDTWGVPHIFGKSDPDAAYGLAYAHAEDDFLTIQQTLVAAQGLLASVYGRDAAPNDYMVHLLRIWDVVEAGYENDLQPETRAILDAYVDGLNHYAAQHPEEVLTARIFPLRGKDIVASSVHKSPLFFGLDNTLAELFAETRQHELSPQPAGFITGFDTYFGSNTFSIGPGRTSDGSTFLAVNSHQPWEGATTWYEAHVHSEDGWDTIGATFPGTPAIIHGHNRDLGWAFTVNHPDLADVYVLEINPENPNQYRFDGQWLDLEVRQAPLKIKLLGNLTLPVNQEVLWSEYGPVVRQDHGTYALRYAGFGLVNIFEQLYRLNKASDLSEWQDAMRGGGLPNFNVGYADRQGNIYYLYNAMLPQRAEGYDWTRYLPGGTSNTLWTEYLPFEQLPQVLNPASGFVQNANSTPYQTTTGPGNPRPEDFSPTLGIETFMSNRALRALELFSSDPSITFDEFVAYKYDWTYSENSDIPRFVGMLAAASYPSSEPDLIRAQEILSQWDLKMAPDSQAATLMVFTLYQLLEDGQGVNASRLVGGQVSQPGLEAAFRRAVAYLVQKFGHVEVPWEQANRLIRGSVDMGLGGGPDVLHATYGYLQEDGRFKGFQGDCYIMLVQWDPQGEVHSYSIHQYGSATLDTNSPHFADQAHLFAKRELKPVWFEEADIRAHLESEYRPGEEIQK